MGRDRRIPNAGRRHPADPPTQGSPGADPEGRAAPPVGRAAVSGSTQAGLRLSLATVYNALNLFAQVGLLRRVDVGERTWFCSNQADHHHMYDEGAAELSDLSAETLTVQGVPDLPPDMQLVRTDIIVRVRRLKV
ncbi:MAG: transcriptional repressor [Magnetospirillum sp.]|nr:transcriptional repressor [Magnetospirillum sp.]